MPTLSNGLAAVRNGARFILLVSALLLVVAGPLHAQNPQLAAPKLSSSGMTTLDKLENLESLPADGWHFHQGDLAHGEDPALDDASWEVVHKGFKGPFEAVWFRRLIQIPPTLNGYDLTGTRIMFQFGVSGNGPQPLMIYFNGRRVAMGEDLEPIVLFENAKPGDKVLVAVKVLQTADVKNFSGADLPIVFTESRPNPKVIREEALSAAALLPVLSTNPAGEQQTLEGAIAAIDIAALNSGSQNETEVVANQQKFDASLRKAQSQMELLKPTLLKASIWLTGNSHIDAAWLWPETETVDVVRRTFGTALQLMYEYPKYTYTQSAAQYDEWMEEKYPDEFKEIQKRVKEGRWEMVGGMWVEPDLNMPDGESQVRQLLIGKNYFQQKFGVDIRIGWNPDSFGYNWQLPQIYKKSGVDYFVTQKMAWNDTNQLPLKLFWWQAPDGSRVLTYFPHDYANPIEPVPMAQAYAQAERLNPGLDEMMHLYGIGDHGGGPTRAMLDEGNSWILPDKVYPRMDFGIAQSYFSAVEGKLDTEHAPVWNYKTLGAGQTTLPQPPAGKMSIPVWNDELYFEYHRGVQTSQAHHKRNMRESEEWMLNSEKLSALAWLGGAPYPAQQLNEAWKKVLFNQFHDLAAGSGIGIIYKDAQREYDMVHFTAQQATDAALGNLAAMVNTAGASGPRGRAGVGGGVPVLVFNPLAWTRDGLVEVTVQMPGAGAGSVAVMDGQGRAVPSEVLDHNSDTNQYRLLVQVHGVPSMGYTVLHAVRGVGARAASDLHVSGTTLENSKLRVKIDPQNGCITSLYDKRANFEAIAAGGCGAQLQTFQDTPKNYDAWNIDEDFQNHQTNIDKADSVQVIENSPMRAVVRVTRTFGKSHFTENIILYANAPRVEVVNDVDWHEDHVLLKAAFPVAASTDHATFEIPYGSIERPTTRNNSVEKAKFEVPALRWADLGDGQHGLSLINESKYGYDAKGNVLRLSLLRSPTWPDPVADRGPQHFAYAVYPHAGDWKEAQTEREGYDFNYKLIAEQVQPHTGMLPPSKSFLSVQGDNVVVTAVKKTEVSDALLIRMYEWAGKAGHVQVTLPANASSAQETNLMEAPFGPALPVTGHQVEFDIKPYEIKTIEVRFANQGAGFWRKAVQ